MERWLPVAGFEEKYLVSDHGRVRSVRSNRHLRPGISGNGYPTVALGRSNTRTVHSLVAEAFLGPVPEGHEVLHLDGSRTNCAASNLRYGTRSENNWQIAADGKRKLSKSEVFDVRILLGLGVQGAALAEALGVSQSHISNIKHRRYFAHG